jgi:hypothetical protein
VVNEGILITSRDVPCKNPLSSLVQMVGTLIDLGKNLIYSVHGVEAHPLPTDEFLLDRIRCVSRYSRISPLVLSLDISIIVMFRAPSPGWY